MAELTSAKPRPVMARCPMDSRINSPLTPGWLAVEIERRQWGQALDFVYSSLFDVNQRTIMDAALRNALPVSAPVRDFLELGALIAYDPDPHELQARVSTIIDKILHGAKPSTIPIAQPARFKLLLNLKAAKRLGIKVPRAVLLRVDEVIQ